MKRIIFIFISVFFIISINAQQNKIDSLKIELSKQLPDSTKLKLFEKLLFEYFYTNLEEGLPYSDSLEFYALKEKNARYLTTAYSYKGQYYNLKGDFKKALKYFKKTLKVDDSVHSIKSLYRDYANIGNAFRYDKQIDSATFYYKKAIEIAEKLKLKNKYISAYGNLAAMYYEAEKHDLAAKYFMKALDSSYHLKGNSRRRIVTVYNNLGTLLLEKKDYKKAQKYLEEAIKLSQELNYKLGIADAGLPLARAYYENNINFDKAEALLLNCIETYKTQGDNRFLINAYDNLGDLYSIENKYDKSIAAYLEAKAIAKESHLNDYYYEVVLSIGEDYFQQKKYRLAKREIDPIIKDTIDAKMKNKTKVYLFKLKSDIEQKLGNYKVASYYKDRLIEAKEKQNQIENKKAVEDILTKYQTEKKEKENLQLKAEKAEQAIALEKESKIKSIYAGSLIFALLILGIFAYYYRRNKKQKSLIENLQKELHHRVKNNLTIIDSLVEDIKDDFNSPGITTRLNDLQNRIESINQVHKQLYKDNRLTELNLRKYVESLAETIQQSFDNQKVKINNEIDDNTAIPVEKSFPLGLIINEFITNSFKYAFDKDKEGTISIKLVEKAKSFLLLLQDDGKGLPDDMNVNQLNSFGIRIMKLLSKQLGGVFSITGKNGVQVEIEFPKQ